MFSKLNDLWQLLYYQRFNAHPDGIDGNWYDDELFWRKVFISAFTNTHDLWIQHWTCALYPQDGILPGRCCIPNSASFIMVKDDACMEQMLNNHKSNKCHEDFLNREESALLQVCPTCRYHPCLPYIKEFRKLALNGYDDNNHHSNNHNSNICHCQLNLSKEEILVEENEMHTKAYTFAGSRGLVTNATQSKALFLSTLYSASKALHVYHELEVLDPNVAGHTFQSDSLDVEIKAEKAFAAAATFERQIETSQFESDGLNFMSDALFFSCTSRFSKYYDREIDELRQVRHLIMERFSTYIF